MLARAIVGRPSLLMVDGALDLFSEEEAEHLVRMLFAPSQPWTVMLVTAKKDLSRFADRSVLLTDGKLSGREENSHGV
jgi:predicted ABC-type transport system involved in lysophospholipase L1 biosynthesis ATPase subunit